MNLQSIINAIKNGVANNATNNYNLEERSFLTELLRRDDNDNAGEVVRLVEFRKLDRSDRFPLTMFLGRNLWALMMLLPWCVYNLCSLCYWALSGKKEHKYRSQRLNFVFFVVAVILSVLTIVMGVSFYIRDVLFLDPNRHINDFGAVAIEQPCGKEHYIFLHNTAIPWSSTGIDLMEGDIVDITVSGSYYGKISDLKQAADSNKKLPYEWNNPGIYPCDIALMDNILQSLCVYRAEDAIFGSLLVQSCPDNRELLYIDSVSDKKGIVQLSCGLAADGKAVRKIPSEKFCYKVDRAGTLYVGVNDIYLDDLTLNTLRGLDKKSIEDNIKDIYLRVNKDSLTNKNLEDQSFLDRVSSVDIPIDTTDVKWAKGAKSLENDSILIFKLAKLKAIAEKYPDVWYADNQGEILLNISLTRNVIIERTLLERMMSHIFRWIESVVTINTLWVLLGLMVAVAMLLYVDNRFVNKEKKSEE